MAKAESSGPARRASLRLPWEAAIAEAPAATAARFVSPAALRKPAWRAPTFWTQHAPFGFWLVEALRPRTFVELGAFWGFSYFALCEAMAALEAPVAAAAVDTWGGDAQNGFYGEEVWRAVAARNGRYAFSSLLRMTFQEARARFPRAGVDLLHIDGLHTEEAVRRDWETWRDALSDRGVALFHDTNVAGRGFGVGRVFAEIRRQHPTFEFTHGYGLGVVCWGKNAPHCVQDLCALADPDAVAHVRAAYARLGAALEGDPRWGDRPAASAAQRLEP